MPKWGRGNVVNGNFFSSFGSDQDARECSTEFGSNFVATPTDGLVGVSRSAWFRDKYAK